MQGRTQFGKLFYLGWILIFVFGRLQKKNNFVKFGRRSVYIRAKYVHEKHNASEANFYKVRIYNLIHSSKKYIIRTNCKHGLEKKLLFIPVTVSNINTICDRNAGFLLRHVLQMQAVIKLVFIYVQCLTVSQK